MVLKKQQFKEGEIAIYDEAVIYKRGEYWQMRMWLQKEGKYARFSLKTRSESTAIVEAKSKYHTLKAQEIAGKTYFSKTTKQGVEEYLEKRKEDVVAKKIVPGRFVTIKTHLEHWLEFIERDKKLKELKRTDCEYYFNNRTKYKKTASISVTTVANEQSTINALMKWLFKRNETYIDSFDFDKLPRVDRRDDKVRRSTFTPTEMDDIVAATELYCDIQLNNLDEDEYKQRQLASYYFLIASVTGLRTGEQKQLRWSDIYWTEATKAKNKVPLVHISVRAETSKVRLSREFLVTDSDYFKKLRKFLVEYSETPPKSDWLIFSFNGEAVMTQRALLYHFGKLVKLAEIENSEMRDIVPYSFRHYFITKKIMSGLPTQSVADMCGTSAAQIEKTYFHLNHQIKLTNALADYEIDEDGLVVTN